MAKMKSLEDLFINLLNDIHYAEKQTWPSYGGPSSTILRRRKDRWSASKKCLLSATPRLPVRPARASRASSKRARREAADAEVLDAGIIADAQAVEHYEIARYARSSPGPISLG